jgi:hypothetical protein
MQRRNEERKITTLLSRCVCVCVCVREREREREREYVCSRQRGYRSERLQMLHDKDVGASPMSWSHTQVMHRCVSTGVNCK